MFGWTFFVHFVQCVCLNPRMEGIQDCDDRRVYLNQEVINGARSAWQSDTLSLRCARSGTKLAGQLSPHLLAKGRRAQRV